MAVVKMKKSKKWIDLDVNMNAKDFLKILKTEIKKIWYRWDIYK